MFIQLIADVYMVGWIACVTAILIFGRAPHSLPPRFQVMPPTGTACRYSL
ncbi:hypothetical protein BH09VER1_BH09VER1_31910 [soil metagenome]